MAASRARTSHSLPPRYFWPTHRNPRLPRVLYAACARARQRHCPSRRRGGGDGAWLASGCVSLLRRAHAPPFLALRPRGPPHDASSAPDASDTPRQDVDPQVTKYLLLGVALGVCVTCVVGASAAAPPRLDVTHPPHPIACCSAWHRSRQRARRNREALLPNSAGGGDQGASRCRGRPHRRRAHQICPSGRRCGQATGPGPRIRPCCGRSRRARPPRPACG